MVYADKDPSGQRSDPTELISGHFMSGDSRKNDWLLSRPAHRSAGAGTTEEDAVVDGYEALTNTEAVNGAVTA